MVAAILGVVKLLLAVDKAVPPEGAAYQSITFPDEAEDINTVPVPHLAPLVPVAIAVVLMMALTVVLEEDMHPEATFLASA